MTWLYCHRDGISAMEMYIMLNSTKLLTKYDVYSVSIVIKQGQLYWHVSNIRLFLIKALFSLKLR